MSTRLKFTEPDAVQKYWQPGERPSVKMAERGAEALSDAELLSIILRNGSGKSAVDMARDLLTHYGSISAVLVDSSDKPLEIARISGEQCARLKAVLELARRALRERLDRGAALSSPQAVRDYLRLKLQGKPHEMFVAVFLDAQNRVLAVEELFRGTLTQTSVFPREIVKRALHFNAAAIIFAHNHPSGVAEPSRADEALTQTLKHTLALVDVKVLDHFVVGGDAAMSFAERGLL